MGAPDGGDDRTARDYGLGFVRADEDEVQSDAVLRGCALRIWALECAHICFLFLCLVFISWSSAEMTNNTGHIVREARNEDIPALIGLLDELFSIEKDFFFDPEAQKRGIELLIRSADDRIFVAEIDKNVVGMCSVQILISTAKGGRVGLVEDVVVSKNYQGQGVGRTLLSAIDNYAKELGLSRLQLLADKNNHLAIGFYRNMGWGNTDLICLHRQ